MKERTVGIVALKKGKEQSIQRFHPWVFSGAVYKAPDDASDGALVEVRSAKGDTLGFGHWNNGSIVVRMFSFGQTPPDDEFWGRKLEDCLSLRKQLGLVGNKTTTAFRLVHAEGDGLPGLVVDIYGGVAVFQAHSIGMHLAKESIARAIHKVCGSFVKAVYDKSQSTLPQGYAQTFREGFLVGKAAQGFILENKAKFWVDFEEGQKTGFFLDQRENRQLLGKYAKGQKVLNAFAYTGGFSVFALLNGAEMVHSVDVSGKAMAIVDKNVEANGFGADKHQSYTEDVLRFLKECEEYDLMVLDPPAFAKSLAKKHNAVQGYKRLNAMGISKLKKGGILFTFSCSQVVDRALFQSTVMAAALEAGRQVRILHFLSQGPDHPVNLFHPEGHYLKGLVLQVT